MPVLHLKYNLINVFHLQKYLKISAGFHEISNIKQYLMVHLMIFLEFKQFLNDIYWLEVILK
jgi:hypothetical protein